MTTPERPAASIRDVAAAVAGRVRGDGRVTVGDLTINAEECRPGVLFCCLPGGRFDRHELAGQALAAGGTALLVERPLPFEVPQIMVVNVRRALPAASGTVFGHPEAGLRLVAVTGTDGKSTTTFMTAWLLEELGPAATIGNLIPQGLNTPETPDLYRRLRQFLEAGSSFVVLEASSAGLVAHRLDGLAFEVAVFTNLGEDHIGEVHESMEDYFLAKRILFEDDRSAIAVVNGDDPYGRRIRDWRKGPTVTYRLEDAVGLKLTSAGSRFSWRGHPVSLPLPGVHNVYDALAAAGAAERAGVDVKAISRRLSELPQPPARFETHQVPDGPLVVIDYAHTPSSLEALLGSARALAAEGRLIVVFGCGGNRDRTKRPQMGSVASTLADVVVLTTDNPRHEDPADIVEAIRQGMAGPAEVVVELDRGSAVALAIDLARTGDIVVLAGKGAEAYQEFAGQRRDYSDAAALEAALASR